MPVGEEAFSADKTHCQTKSSPKAGSFALLQFRDKSEFELLYHEGVLICDAFETVNVCVALAGFGYSVGLALAVFIGI